MIYIMNESVIYIVSLLYNEHNVLDFIQESAVYMHHHSYLPEDLSHVDPSARGGRFNG